MKLRFLPACLCLLICLSACAPVTQAAPAQVVISIYNPPAADPWLQEAFTCAEEQAVVLSVVNDPGTADLQLRIGEPPGLTGPAYQIDTEEILVVTHRESPVQNLSLEQVRELFAGRGDPSVQVWVYSDGDDIQRAFEALVMQGGLVTSLARLAVTPQQMSDVLNTELNTVGVLPRHWKTGTPRQVYSAGTVPVLAVTRAEPEGALASLIACLQK